MNSYVGPILLSRITYFRGSDSFTALNIIQCPWLRSSCRPFGIPSPPPRPDPQNGIIYTRPCVMVIQDMTILEALGDGEVGLSPGQRPVGQGTGAGPQLHTGRLRASLSTCGKTEVTERVLQISAERLECYHNYSNYLQTKAKARRRSPAPAGRPVLGARFLSFFLTPNDPGGEVRWSSCNRAVRPPPGRGQHGSRAVPAALLATHFS